MAKKTTTSYPRLILAMWVLAACFIGGIFLLFAITAAGAFGPLPKWDEIENPKNQLATEVYSADGLLIGKFYFQNRSEATFDEIPPLLKKTLLATEDIRFYQHSGIDYWGTVGAIFSTAMGDKRGASTVTQQLAKNLFPRPESRSLVHVLPSKLKEWITAVKLERRYTKDEIINLYFNTVEFSENSFGIKSASRTYFNKSPDSLKVEEAALLVGMLKGSTMYNPRRNPRLSLGRRNTVIDQMAKYGFLAAAEADSIKARPIKLNFISPDHNEGTATYFREVLRQELVRWCKDNVKTNGEHYNIYTDGLKVYTTLDSKLQRYAEEAVWDHMKELQANFFTAYKNAPPWGKDETFIEQAMKQTDRWYRMKREGISEDSIRRSFRTKIPMTVFTYNGEKDTVMSPLDSLKYYKHFLHCGFMAMDPQTGYVRAWVGGVNHRYFKYDHVNVNAKRQVGSTIKPILYTVAIENGYSPCYRVPNTKVVFENFNNWAPENSDNKYGGILTLYQGLSGSVNTISAYLMKQIGPKPMIDMARRMGITSHMDPYPSICLGTPDISVYELTGAYSTFANKGVYTKPIYIKRIADNQDVTVQEFHSKRVEVVNESVAFTLCRMLQNVVNNGTARRLRFRYKLEGEIGGKTGTTQNSTDGWFMGITPQIAAGCWVGGDDRIIRFKTMLYGQGASMALPVFGNFLQKAYADKSSGLDAVATFAPPEGPMSIELDCGRYGAGSDEDNTTRLIFGEE
ncbi:MAG TPA: transglycosylase domain-containing protein [Chitinophagales bacterium]|nr:transglycosylase domain-containing protein [Chitinophagales bacterium]